MATTEADFFTLLDREEETQQHLNELSAQLCETPAPHSKEPHRAKKGQAHAPDERTRSTRFGTSKNTVPRGRLCNSNPRDIR